MSSIARVLPDGSFNYKPKRDVNGIIQCKSRIDQEACIYADNVRKLRQHEYDKPPCIPTVRKKSWNRMNVAHKTSLNPNRSLGFLFAVRHREILMTDFLYK